MACDPKGVVGLNGKLPWHIPEELNFFRNTTIGHVMVMGRKTFETLPNKARENRIVIVISSTLSQELSNDHVLIYDSIESFCQNVPEFPGKKFFLIGGPTLVKEFFARDLIDKFLLTRIRDEYPGDSFLDLKLLEPWRMDRSVIEVTDKAAVIEYTRPPDRKIAPGDRR